MKKEAKVHLLYGSIILVLTLFFIYSNNEQTKTFTNSLASMQSDLTTQIQKIQNDLQATSQTLEQKNQALQSSLTRLNSSLQEKERSLTGKIQQVQTQSEEQLSQVQDTITNLKLQNQDFSEVIDQTIPAVVSIRTNTGRGSGFIINTDGTLVTNYHVIKNARTASAQTLDGEIHALRIIGFNERADIAVLQINATNLQRIRFGNSDDLKVGEKVIAVGSPGGFDFSVSQGIVSATNRHDQQGREFVQIDVPINPGNSGGPLVNAVGQVVGVNTLKISQFEGIGFALSSNFVKAVVDDIIEQKSH